MGFSQIEECGFDYLTKQLFETDSTIRNIILNNDFNTNNEQAGQHIAEDSVVEIIFTSPVVVHVIHLCESIGIGTNISDDQIYGAITGLNERFSNLVGVGLDVGIQFCLAQRDPDGNATNGVDRHDGSGIIGYEDYGVNYYYEDGCDDGPSHSSISNLYRWPVNDYYNIYILNTFDCGGGPSAFAYLPFWFAETGNMYDGSYFKYTSFTQLSTTPTHELGHGFNLYHTFNGDGGGLYCPIDTNCLTNGDQVCDTPPHKSGDCGAINPCSLIDPFSNSKNNYLSYCPTKNLFTEGQKVRMREIMDHKARKDLIDNPWVCEPVTSIDISINATQNVNYVNENCDFINFYITNTCDSVIHYFEVVAKADDEIVGSNTYEVILEPGASVSITFPVDIPTGTSELMIFCSNPNMIGIYDDKPENNFIYYNLLTINTNLCEDFEGDYLENGFLNYESMEFIPFLEANTVCMGNFIYQDIQCYMELVDSVAINQLITSYDIINVDSLADAFLTIDISSKDDYLLDATTTLYVFISSCASPLDTLLSLSGSELATVDGVTTGCTYPDWIPLSCSDWESIQIDLCDYLGEYVTIIFEIQSEYGSGQVYLDNICLHKIGKPQAIEVMESCEEIIQLIANDVENGYWEIISGEGGFVYNTHNPNSLFSGTPSTSYLVTWNYMNACGQLYSDTLAISLLGPAIPIVEIDEVLCTGDTLNLFTVFDESLNYFWSGPGGFTSTSNDVTIYDVSELNTGTYYLYTVNVNGCSSDTIVFTVNIFPVPDVPEINGTDTVCEGELIELFSLYTPGYIYHWSGPTGIYMFEDTLIITSSLPVNEGVYQLYVEANGCFSNSSNFLVTVNDKPDVDLNLVGDSEFCLGDSLIIEIMQDDLIYNWSTGDETQVIVVYTAGDYFVTVVDSLGCSDNSDTINVITHSAPIANFNILDSIMCINDTPLPLIYGSPTGGVYSGTGVIDDIYYPNIAGIGFNYIYYTYTNIYGCSITVADSMTILDLPSVELNLPFDTICYDVGPILIDYGLPAGGEYSGTGVIGNYLDPIEAGIGQHEIFYYYTDENGCYSVDSFLITVSDCITIGIIDENKPDKVIIIQPNPNNGNFTLLLNSNYLGEVEISLFNSIGDMVFYEKDDLVPGAYSKDYRLNNLATGTYLIKVVSDNASFVGKLIIEAN